MVAEVTGRSRRQHSASARRSARSRAGRAALPRRLAAPGNPEGRTCHVQEQFRQPGRAALGPGGVRDDAGSDPRPVTGPVPAQPADAAAASWPARMDDL
jgi:hypothetical protein